MGSRLERGHAIEGSFWRSVTPEVLLRAIADDDNRRFVQTVLTTLTNDPVWTRHIVDQAAEGRVEVRCVLACLAREMQPRHYLEVGVRRGFSMAVVAARCPQVAIYGFDQWIAAYGGVDNPGPAFVRVELERVGYSGSAQFVSGNSHRTLPAFFGLRRASTLDRLRFAYRYRGRPRYFDLITIDGDHSLLGAYQDLLDTMPFCAIGGAVVFDDIAQGLSTLDPEAVQAERGEDPHGWRDLLGVWRAVQRQFRNFRYFEYVEHSPGVGVAVRLW